MALNLVMYGENKSFEDIITYFFNILKYENIFDVESV